MDQTGQEGAPINPLALRFMDAIANMVDRALRESSRDANSRKEMEKMLDKLNKLLASHSTKSS
jgi:hypothetical protein